MAESDELAFSDLGPDHTWILSGLGGCIEVVFNYFNYFQYLNVSFVTVGNITNCNNDDIK